MAAYRSNHIVSKFYLARWAGSDGRLRVGRTRDRQLVSRRPEKVGYRNFFWGRNSTVRKHAEEHVNKIESYAADALHRLRQQWPPAPGSPDWLGLVFLVAVHLWRNPSGQQRLLQIQEQTLEQRSSGYTAGWTEQQISEFFTRVKSDEFRTNIMLGDLHKAASLLGSMHWTLIEFDECLLGTSDQPVTVVPLLKPPTTGSSIAHPQIPLLECEEIRMPLGPQHALLFTWRDEPIEAQPISGNESLAADLNRAVIAQADEEWFHHPDCPTSLVPPALDEGPCSAIGREILPGYGWQSATGSRRRSDAASIIERMIEDDVDGEVRVVKVEPAVPAR